jgi:site-specific recombinase XerD
MNIQQAADQFIIDKQLSNLSKITINNYKKVLKEFASLYGEVELEDYDSSMVREFLVHLRSRENLTDGSTGLSQTSIELYYRVVHNFSKWCVSQEFITTSPTEKVPRPRLDKLLPETISDEKLVALFQLLENKTTTRIRLIFEFFLDQVAGLVRLPYLMLMMFILKMVGQKSTEKAAVKQLFPWVVI